MDGVSVGDGYAEQLTRADLRLIAAVTEPPGPPGQSGPPGPPAQPGDPATLERQLADPRVFEAIFGPDSLASRETVLVSPFLAFAVAVHRAAADLAEVRYVAERSAARQRVPVFDAPELRDFLGSAERRLFLAELLSSFTRVTSGRYEVSVGGRSRTRRFSELDPVRLAGLLDGVPDAERPGVYRRLGDVSLFVAGVFPDYATLYGVGPASVARLLSAAQVPAAEQERLATVPAIELLEQLGARWYRAAHHLAPVRTARLDVVADVAGRFQQARRVLNHIADRYLFATDHPWFAPPAS